MESSGGAMRMGKYEMGRTLGEGHFGKVRLARHADDGRAFAIKILDRQRILAMKIDEQIKREIATLKLLKHPNIVRLYEVSASKTKIYMVLEYVNGGELFDKIALKGKLSEKEGRKLFQQLMDAVSYCHDKGVYHRDLKPENVLVDAKGNIKVSDFGLSAFSQHQRKDGLLHTTCGSPNYIAPEVLLNRGYDGSLSDIWSCGVILYVMLTGNLPFDDQNMVVLYQKILKGDAHIPKWLSPGAQDILRKMLDPNPITRFGMDGIKAHDWFSQVYTSAVPFDDDDDNNIGADNPHMTKHNDIQDNPAINQINAFQLIGMSSCLDLSGFFEKEDVSERKIRFASNHSPRYLFEKIESNVTKMGFQVQKNNGKLKVIQDCKGPVNPRGYGSLLISAEVFEINESLYVVELKRSSGDCSLYRQLCATLSNDLGVCKSQQHWKKDSMRQELFRYSSSFFGTAKFWTSRWLHHAAPREIAPDLFTLANRKHRTVAYELQDNRWMRPLRVIHTTPQVHQFATLWNLIREVQLDAHTPDRIAWRWTGNAQYTAKSAYNFQFIGTYNSFDTTTIWTAETEHKVKIHIWLLLQHKILTADRLVQRGWDNGLICTLCGIHTETASHITIGCAFARQVLRQVATMNGITTVDFLHSNQDNLSTWWCLCGSTWGKKDRRKKYGILAYALWNIWKERNARVFNNVLTDVHTVALKAQQDITSRRLAFCRTSNDTGDPLPS